jgi:hypothetical protein
MNKFFSLIILGCSLIVTVSCSSEHIEGEKIPLKNNQINHNHTLSFTAVSNGCSQNSDFSIHVNRQEKDTVFISIVRSKKDLCRRLPFFQTFQLNIPSDLFNKTLVIQNPTVQALMKNNN